MLIWYWNTQYTDNNVGDHPGEGEILPVDAHPQIMHWADGSVVRARIESYDSTFGVKKTDAITLHKPAFRRRSSRSRACRSSTTCRAGGRRPIRATPSATIRPRWTSVNVPKTGTKVQVKGATKKDCSVDIEVTPAPAS